jgi:hypothetical protein
MSLLLVKLVPGLSTAEQVAVIARNGGTDPSAASGIGSKSWAWTLIPPSANLQKLLLPLKNVACARWGGQRLRLALPRSLENPGVAVSPSQGESLAYILHFPSAWPVDDDQERCTNQTSEERMRRLP